METILPVSCYLFLGQKATPRFISEKKWEKKICSVPHLSVKVYSQSLELITRVNHGVV